MLSLVPRSLHPSFFHTHTRTRTHTHTVMSDAVSLSLVSDPESPFGRTGVNVHIICTANLSSIVNTPVTMQGQLLDPAGSILATETSNSSSVHIRSLINSFMTEHAGNYACTVTITSPALRRSIIKVDKVHFYIGKLYSSTNLV